MHLDEIQCFVLNYNDDELYSKTTHILVIYISLEKDVYCKNKAIVNRRVFNVLKHW